MSDTSQSQDDPTIEELVKEFQSIVVELENLEAIPEDEITKEQLLYAIKLHKRLEEILFTIQFKYNIADLVLDLKAKLEKYNQLVIEYDKLLENLEAIYEKELKIYNDLQLIYDKEKEYIKTLQVQSNKISLIGSFGYVINFNGMDFGLSMLFPINKTFSIGLGLDWITDFKGVNYFAINLAFSLSF